MNLGAIRQQKVVVSHINVPSPHTANSTTNPSITHPAGIAKVVGSNLAALAGVSAGNPAAAGSIQQVPNLATTGAAGVHSTVTTIPIGKGVRWILSFDKLY